MKKLKYTIAGWVKQEPHAWALVWNLMPRLTFLLPHDKSYYGFRHLADQERGLFLDVGANNGISAAGFRRINDTYDIFSIEASRHHEEALKRLQRSISRFQYRRLGAGSEKGSFVLFTPMYRGIPIHSHASTSKEYLTVSLGRDFSSRVVKNISYDEQVVPVVPLDDLKLEPDIVKIDAEGFDYQVLVGMRNTIEKHRPYIMIEYTPEQMGDFESMFSELGYSMFVYDELKDRFSGFQESRETQTWRTTAVQVNLFCVPDEKGSVLPLSGA
ncbi:MAG TPA: FkbM family methyltransferase [Gammaproteobacteria bacterium]